MLSTVAISTYAISFDTNLLEYPGVTCRNKHTLPGERLDCLKTDFCSKKLTIGLPIKLLTQYVTNTQISSVLLDSLEYGFLIQNIIEMFDKVSNDEIFYKLLLKHFLDSSQLSKILSKYSLVSSIFGLSGDSMLFGLVGGSGDAYLLKQLGIEKTVEFDMVYLGFMEAQDIISCEKNLENVYHYYAKIINQFNNL